MFSAYQQTQEAGYEKLHNFLSDVAGLSLIGAGNRMELKLGDRDAFERFCDDLLVGREDLLLLERESSEQWKTCIFYDV